MTRHESRHKRGERNVERKVEQALDQKDGKADTRGKIGSSKNTNEEPAKQSNPR